MTDPPRVPRAWAHGRVDLVVVLVLLGTDLTAQAVARTEADVTSASLSAAAVGWAVASAGVVRLRRSRPILTLVGSAAAAGLCAGAIPPGLFSQQTGLTVIVSTYAIGSWSDRRVASVAVPVVAVGLLVIGARDDGSDLVSALAVGLAAVGLPWMAGRAARSRRHYVEEVERRLVAAERERDERARRAVLDERTHIARELHDVVAHHVSLIGVQAGAARTALDSSPDATRRALLAIEASSRAAVSEMHTLLGALRNGDDAASPVPLPELGDLEGLAEGFRSAGLAVSLSAPVAGLPPALALTTYRIVEEALTNVTRHSAAPGATVEVTVEGSALRLRVHDPGPRRGGTTAGSGRGLLGVAERVDLFGGEHRAAATADGGFEVAATIPLRAP